MDDSGFRCDLTIVYVGLTGLARTGKGKVADLLFEFGEASGWAVLRYSLSDEIRGELLRSCRSEGSIHASKVRMPSRIQLIELGNERRRQFGTGYWARRVLDRIAGGLSSQDQSPTLVIIDSIRHPGEVLELRRTLGKRFILVGITATSEVRHRRGQESQRPGEESGLPAQVEEADRAIGIDTCLSEADLVIQNNDSLPELSAKIEQLGECVLRRSASE